MSTLARNEWAVKPVIGMMSPPLPARRQDFVVNWIFHDINNYNNSHIWLFYGAICWGAKVPQNSSPLKEESTQLFHGLLLKISLALVSQHNYWQTPIQTCRQGVFSP